MAFWACQDRGRGRGPWRILAPDQDPGPSRYLLGPIPAATEGPDRSSRPKKGFKRTHLGRDGSLLPVHTDFRGALEQKVRLDPVTCWVTIYRRRDGIKPRLIGCETKFDAFPRATSRV